VANTGSTGGYSTKAKTICVLGGTGFVGQHVVNQLTKNRVHVKVLTRRRENHRDLLVFPTVELIEADIHDAAQLKQHFKGCDAVINLVGILYEGSKKQTFQAAHVELARKVIDACKATRVKRLLHMSALHADAGRGTSRYLRSKGEAENLIHTTKSLNVTSFRPSVIFGPEDNLLNRFAALLRMTPKPLPILLPCAKTRFAPIYVEDVATIICQSVDNRACFGKHYNLCGPKQYTFKELMQYTGELIGEKRMIWGLGAGLSKLQAIVFSLLPGHLFTVDNYLSMRTDSVCKEEFPADFNLTPKSLDNIAPLYLTQAQARGRFFQYRQHARRD